MTVVGSFAYSVRPYSGYSEPGLPIASYIAQGGLVGDASGGNVVFTFEYMTEQEEKITELFNLEQYEVDTDGTAQTFMIETVNMDTLSRNRAASKRKWANSTSTHDSDSALNPIEDLVRPVWLGSPNLDARAGTAGLRFTFINSNLRLFAVTIQGYIWSARSILAEGGPRRPVGGGLFGS